MTDREIIDKIRSPTGQSLGFNMLVRAYQERIYWHVRKMVVDHDDADDLVQDIFVKIWRNIDKFREDSSLFTWIYRIATNECLNFLKKKRSKFFLPINDIAEELIGCLEQAEHVSGDRIQMALQRAILVLPDKQRLVFNMKYFDEMTFEQISGITGTSIGALKASYHLAVKKIEQNLNAD